MIAGELQSSAYLKYLPHESHPGLALPMDEKSVLVNLKKAARLQIERVLFLSKQQQSVMHFIGTRSTAASKRSRAVLGERKRHGEREREKGGKSIAASSAAPRSSPRRKISARPSTDFVMLRNVPLSICRIKILEGALPARGCAS